jgi:hypothetical protein
MVSLNLLFQNIKKHLFQFRLLCSLKVVMFGYHQSLSSWSNIFMGMSQSDTPECNAVRGSFL